MRKTIIKLLEPQIKANRRQIANGLPSSSFTKFLLARLQKKIRSFHKVNVHKNNSIQGKYSGKRCVIMGSAPSINELPLDVIEDDFVFVLNKAYLLSERLGRPAQAIVMSDRLAYVDYGKDIDWGRFGYVFMITSIEEATELNNTYWFDVFKFPTIYDGFVAIDITAPLYHGHTVALYACQIAMAMGFSELILIGIDLSFNTESPHFYRSSAREKEWVREVSLKRKDNMAAAFRVLARECKLRGISLINASPVEGLPGVARKRFLEVYPTPGAA